MKIILMTADTYFTHEYTFKSLWAASIIMARLAKADPAIVDACIIDETTGEVLATL